MTFIIAMQAEDSLIVSADNTTIAFSNRTAFRRNIASRKLHDWSGGVFTGTGEYGVVQHTLGHLIHGAALSSLPALLAHEKEHRRQEAGPNEQIDITRLILSAPTPHGPRLHIVTDDAIEQIGPGELLMFFPLDYDFFAASSEAISDLNATLRPKSAFATLDEWISFYAGKFAEIYTLQSENNELISRSFHVHFQAEEQSLMFFAENSP
ncbi:hypothetical protein VA599_06005 [Chromobacterium sp. TRC.1.1.SA]|uniref:Uncharacterized protein n=1 Tax=Chromobacterium indicum TaxID=3110228 RepID=A0ABV0CHE8_9NEIS